jgi:hypothetical protein
MKDIVDSLVPDFMNLFKGGEQGYATFRDGAKKPTPYRKPATALEYREHLNGEMRLALVPFQKNGLCWYGALDFDNHEGDTIHPPIDIAKLSRKIHDLGLPAIACVSKRGGGAHVYVFGSEPLNGVKLVNYLTKKLKPMLLGVGEVSSKLIEVFPKQLKLSTPSAIGNHLSLPFYDSLKGKMFGMVNGEMVNVRKFMDHAKNIRITNADLRTYLSEGLPDESHAPPCIDILMSTPVTDYRNNSLYAYGVYAKKAFPENWKEKITEFNNLNMESPLPIDEIRGVLSSLTGKSYNYKCSDEPCFSRCDKPTCVLRKFGISHKEREALDVAEMPSFDNLRKYMTDPIRWELDVDGVSMYLSTDELMQFRLFRKRVLETLSRVVTTIPAKEWEIIINRLLKSIEVIEVPDEATRPGIIQAALFDYCKKVDLDDPGTSVENRAKLNRGTPMVYKDSYSRKKICFKGTMFLKHVQNLRLGLSTSSTVWMALQKISVYPTKIHISTGNKINVWAINLDDFLHFRNIKSKAQDEDDNDADEGWIEEEVDTDNFDMEEAF